MEGTAAASSSGSQKATPLAFGATRASTSPTRPPPVKAYKEGRELFYKLRNEPLYTPAELTFLRRRFADLSERITQTIAPRVILVCDHDLHFVANAVLLTLLGCEVEGCRNVASAMELVAPHFRPMEYSPPDLIVIEKWKSGRSGADYSVRDLCYHIRSRDQNYTKETGFICRSNIIGIATPNLTIFDASDSSADLVLRGTLFRNIDMVRKLLLPTAVINQGRLRVHRAVSNFAKIQRLLQPAPIAPNPDGTIKFDDEQTQVLAMQRVAGDLEQEIAYLKDVIRYKDKELGQMKKVSTDTDAQHATEKAKLGDVISSLRKSNAALEEDKGRIMAHAAKLTAEIKNSTNQSKLMQVQMMHKAKLTKLRQQTKQVDDDDSNSSKNKLAIDEATAAAWHKMSFSSVRMAAMAPAVATVAVQCTLLQPNKLQPSPTRPNFNASITNASLTTAPSFAPEGMAMLPGIQIVDEVIDVRGSASPKSAENNILAQRILALEAQVKELEHRLAGADQRNVSLSTQLLDAQGKLTTAFSNMRDIQSTTGDSESKLSQLEFENGRLQEMIAIAKDDRDAAQQVAMKAEKQMQELKETVTLLEERLRDGESLIVDKRVELHKEAEAQRTADKSQTSDLQRAFRRRQGKELLLRCVLLAALTKRASQTETLQRAIAAADAKVVELKATIKEAKGGKGGGAPTKAAKGEEASAHAADAKPEGRVRTKTTETEPDPTLDLWVAFQKQATSLVEVEANFGRVQQLYKDARSLVNPIEKELDNTKSALGQAIKAKAAAEEVAEKAAKEAQAAKEEMEHHSYMSNKQKGEIAELKEQLANASRQTSMATSQLQSAVTAAKEFELECGRLREQVQNLQRRIAELEAFNNSNANVLAATRDELRKVTKANNLTERMTQESTQRITAAEELAESLKLQCETQRSRIAELESLLLARRKSLAPPPLPTQMESPFTEPPPNQREASMEDPHPSNNHHGDANRRQSVASNVDVHPRARSFAVNPTPGSTSALDDVSSERPISQQQQIELADDAPSFTDPPMVESQSFLVSSSGAPASPSPARIIYRTRVVVGEVDETKLNELREEIVQLQKVNAELEERLKASKKELGESRGLVGTYKDSQASLRRTVEDSMATMEQQSNEIKTLTDALEAVRDNAARVGPLRDKLAELVQTWGSLSRNGPYDLQDDRSERWAYAAATHCIEEGVQVMSVVNRAKVATIDNLTQTTAQWVGQIERPKETASVAVQHLPQTATTGTFMLVPECDHLETQTEALVVDHAGCQTEWPLPRQLSTHDLPQLLSTRTSTVDTPTGAVDPPQRDSGTNSRQLSRNGGVRLSLMSRERSNVRLALEDPTIPDTPSSRGVLPPLPAVIPKQRRQPTTPHHSDNAAAIAQLLRSGGGSGANFGEVLFETDSRATQTDDVLPAAPRVTADTQTDAVSIVTTAVERRPVSAQTNDTPPTTSATRAPVVTATVALSPLTLDVPLSPTKALHETRPQSAQTDAPPRSLHDECQTELSGRVVRHVEPPVMVSRETVLTPATTQPKRIITFADMGTQVHPRAVNTIATQATPHPVPTAHANTQSSKVPTAHNASQTDKRKKPTSDVAVQISDELGVSASAAAMQKIVSSVANLHRALHNLFLKANLAIPTAAEMRVPPSMMISTAKVALESLTIDTIAASTLSEALSKWVKLERAEKNDDKSLRHDRGLSPLRNRPTVTANGGVSPPAQPGANATPPRPRPGVPVYKMADDPVLSPLYTAMGPITFAAGLPVGLGSGRNRGSLPNRTPSPPSRMAHRLPTLASTPEPAQQRLLHISSSPLLAKITTSLSAGAAVSPTRRAGDITVSPLRVVPKPAQATGVVRMR